MCATHTHHASCPIHVRVHTIRQPLPAQTGQQVLRGHQFHLVPRGDAGAGDVRRDQAVVQGQQRAVGWERLRVGDVQRGRWTTGMRGVALANKLFSLAVLVLLVVGHNNWFAAAGFPGLFAGLTVLPTAINDRIAFVGMWGFRIGFAVATVITALAAVGLAVRLVQPTATTPADFKPAIR